MKTIVILLISVVLAVPMIAMGADYPSLCFSCISDQGSVHVRGADGSLCMNCSDNNIYGILYGSSDLNGRLIVEPESGKIGIGTVFPNYDIEVQMDGPLAEKANVIAFRWAHEVKCFDFVHLREHKQFKEIPCK